MAKELLFPTIISRIPRLGASNIFARPVPFAGVHIHAAVEQKRDAFVNQHRAAQFRVRPSRDRPVRPYNALPGQILRAGAQSPADSARGARAAKQSGDPPVGQDLSAGDRRNDFINAVKERIFLFTQRPGPSWRPRLSGNPRYWRPRRNCLHSRTLSLRRAYWRRCLP